MNAEIEGYFSLVFIHGALGKSDFSDNFVSFGFENFAAVLMLAVSLRFLLSFLRGFELVSWLRSRFSLIEWVLQSFLWPSNEGFGIYGAGKSLVEPQHNCFEILRCEKKKLLGN